MMSFVVAGCLFTLTEKTGGAPLLALFETWDSTAASSLGFSWKSKERRLPHLLRITGNWQLATDRSCNNYSVTSTRQCLFNHTRPPALSMTCKPAQRDNGHPIAPCMYTHIRILLPAQNVPRGTLYVQLNAASRRRGNFSFLPTPDRK